MKDYKKFLRGMLKDPDFELIRTTRRSPTVKLRYIKTGQIYSIHPGNNAIRPVRKWANKIKKKK